MIRAVTLHPNKPAGAGAAVAAAASSGAAGGDATVATTAASSGAGGITVATAELPGVAASPGVTGVGGGAGGGAGEVLVLSGGDGGGGRLTPVRRQWLTIKHSYPDAILLFRMGDFYECFDEDAHTLAAALEIALTARPMGKGYPAVPLAGIPVVSLEANLARLIRQGYKVAICEQLSDPAASRGIVERGVVRVVTPGTVLESALLDHKANNYLAAVCLDDRSGNRVRAGSGVGSGVGPGAGTGTGVGIRSGSGLDNRAGVGSGAGAGIGTGVGSGVGLDNRAGVGSGAGAGIGMGVGSGAGLDNRAGTGTGIGSGAGLDNRAGNGAGVGSGAGLDNRAGVGIGVGSGDGLDYGAGVGSGAKPGAGAAGAEGEVGLAYVDVTTGEFAVAQLPASRLAMELARLEPSETLVAAGDGLPDLGIDAGGEVDIPLTAVDAAAFQPEVARRALLGHYGVLSLEAYGLEAHGAVTLPLAVRAAGAIIDYLRYTYQGEHPTLLPPAAYRTDAYMTLDPQTRRNLELFAAGRWDSRELSLFAALDDTRTAMGARLLRRWLGRPLLDRARVERRLDVVQFFYDDAFRRADASAALGAIADLERILSRVQTNAAGPRELLALRRSLEAAERLGGVIGPADGFDGDAVGNGDGDGGGVPDAVADDGGTADGDGGGVADAVRRLAAELRPMPELAGLIDDAINPEPSGSVGDGSVIRAGFFRRAG